MLQNLISFEVEFRYNMLFCFEFHPWRDTVKSKESQRQLITQKKGSYCLELSFGNAIAIKNDSRGFKSRALVELNEKFSDHGGEILYQKWSGASRFLRFGCVNNERKEPRFLSHIKNEGPNQNICSEKRQLCISHFYTVSGVGGILSDSQSSDVFL